MATVSELATSRTTVEDQRHERRYYVTGAAAETDAITAVRGAASCPSTYDGMPRSEIRVESLDGDETWMATAVWSTSTSQSRQLTTTPLSGTVINGTTAGGTEHITQARSVISRYVPAGETAADYEGAIGVSEDGVAGLDIVKRVFRFSVTKVYASGSYPTLSDLYGLTGKVNSDSVTYTDSVTSISISFSAGELLCEGCDFSNSRQDGGLEVTYYFAAIPNQTGLTIGDITGIAKKGWEYLWVHYTEQEDAAADRIVRVPDQVTVVQVYETTTFSGVI